MLATPRTKSAGNQTTRFISVLLEWRCQINNGQLQIDCKTAAVDVARRERKVASAAAAQDRVCYRGRSLPGHNLLPTSAFFDADQRNGSFDVGQYRTALARVWAASARENPRAGAMIITMPRHKFSRRRQDQKNKDFIKTRAMRRPFMSLTLMLVASIYCVARFFGFLLGR